MSDSERRKEYDESIFGVEKEAYKDNDAKFMATGVPKRAPGEQFVSGEFEEANNQFDRFERNVKHKIFKAKQLLENPFQNLAKEGYHKWSGLLEFPKPAGILARALN